jgi:hypothetical protein
MSLTTTSEETLVVPDQTGPRIDLHLRWLQAVIADPDIAGNIPRDAFLFLLPDDDPAFVEGEIAAGLLALRRGHDVYFRHVRTADLPDLPPIEPFLAVGAQRVTYDEDGNIVTNQIFGADGQWHDTDQPPPGPRDDDPAELFP